MEVLDSMGMQRVVQQRAVVREEVVGHSYDVSPADFVAVKMAEAWLCLLVFHDQWKMRSDVLNGLNPLSVHPACNLVVHCSMAGLKVFAGVQYMTELQVEDERMAETVLDSKQAGTVFAHKETWCFASTDVGKAVSGP